MPPEYYLGGKFKDDTPKFAAFPANRVYFNFITDKLVVFPRTLRRVSLQYTFVGFL